VTASGPSDRSKRFSVCEVSGRRSLRDCENT
jgi:hypothetical protein